MKDMNMSNIITLQTIPLSEYLVARWPAFYDPFPDHEDEMNAEMMAGIEAEASRLGMPIAADGRYPLVLWELATARAV